MAWLTFSTSVKSRNKRIERSLAQSVFISIIIIILVIKTNKKFPAWTNFHPNTSTNLSFHHLCMNEPMYLFTPPLLSWFNLKTERKRKKESLVLFRCLKAVLVILPKAKSASFLYVFQAWICALAWQKPLNSQGSPCWHHATSSSWLMHGSIDRSVALLSDQLSGDRSP